MKYYLLLNEGATGNILNTDAKTQFQSEVGAELPYIPVDSLVTAYQKAYALVKVNRILWSINYPKLEVYIYEKKSDQYLYIDNVL